MYFAIIFAKTKHFAKTVLASSQGVQTEIFLIKKGVEKQNKNKVSIEQDVNIFYCTTVVCM